MALFGLWEILSFFHFPQILRKDNQPDNIQCFQMSSFYVFLGGNPDFLPYWGRYSKKATIIQEQYMASGIYAQLTVIKSTVDVL